MGSVSWSVSRGYQAGIAGARAPPSSRTVFPSVGTGTGSVASSMVAEAPGQAARTAAATGPAATVPGSHTWMVSARPAHRYSSAACGVP